MRVASSAVAIGGGGRVAHRLCNPFLKAHKCTAMQGEDSPTRHAGGGERELPTLWTLSMPSMAEGGIPSALESLYTFTVNTDRKGGARALSLRGFGEHLNYYAVIVGALRSRRKRF